MNDNDKASGPEVRLFEIIESFAHGYHAALALFTTTEREVLVLKLVIVSALVTAWSFVMAHATNFNSVTAMAANVAIALSFALWRIFKLENQLEKMSVERQQ
jgi:hypothetical protein